MMKPDYNYGITPGNENDHGNWDDNDDIHVPDPGPLGVMPSLRYIHPAMIMYAFFTILSLFYWQSAIRDFLWISGESIFAHNEYWRVLTSICVHANAVHLLSNSLLFFVFGWLLHAYFGWLLFPFAAILGGVISSVLTVMIYDPGIRLIGASGMVYGMVGLWLVFYIRYDTGHRWPVRLMRAIGFALIMMFPTVYNPSTSYLAHAIGFVTGLVIGISLMEFVKPRGIVISIKK